MAGRAICGSLAPWGRWSHAAAAATRMNNLAAAATEASCSSSSPHAGASSAAAAPSAAAAGGSGTGSIHHFQQQHAGISFSNITSSSSSSITSSSGGISSSSSGITSSSSSDGLLPCWLTGRSSAPLKTSPFLARALHSSPRPAASHAQPAEAPPASSSAAAAAAAASSSPPPRELPPAPDVDPFAIVAPEVDAISERLRHSVVSHVPALRAAADYYFRPGVRGKRLRPTLVMLLAGALSGAPPPGEWAAPDLRAPGEPPAEPRRRAQRMAEIAETIHVASLLHDDVLDDASTRRGVLSLNAASGDKLAILAGDFLLARASATIASLRHHDVTALMSSVLESLVAGEVMQMAADGAALESLDFYLEKTYCKTASLMANSGRCVALLSGADDARCDAAWEFGRRLGLAFQIVDDVLDLTGDSSVLGKPALNDLRAGLATAPVLLAARARPALLPLARRKFRGRGDVAAAVALVAEGGGVEAARALAAEHAAAAAAQARLLLGPAPDAHAQLCSDALIAITHRVLNRRK